jgi:hypothetical protein
MGVNTRAANVKLINLVVHDQSGNGIGFWMEAANSDLYGCIIFNNGYQGTDRGHGHNIYTENQVPSHQLIAENILFNPFYYDIQAFGYSSSGQHVENYNFVGNVAFNGGTLSNNSTAAEYQIGGNLVASGISYDHNYSYRTNAAQMTADIGWTNSPNQDLSFTNNYLVGQFSNTHWATATVNGNTVYNPWNGAFGGLVNLNPAVGQSWGANTFYGDPTAPAWILAGSAYSFAAWKTVSGIATPGTYGGTTPPNLVVVRPNAYEAGRANIIAYNWAQQGAVTVDVSGVLRSGDHYVVQNAQDFFGAPVATGIYSGGSISLPMAAISPPPLVGVGPSPAPVTGPTFQVFVLMKT